MKNDLDKQRRGRRRLDLALLCASASASISAGCTLWVLMYSDLGRMAASADTDTGMAAFVAGLFIVSGVATLTGLIAAGLVLYMTEGR